MKKNPFIYTDAVPPDMFFNRKREIEMFCRMLSSGERKLLIAIVAPLKFGKTSLMLKYIEIVKRYSDIIPIYIDLRRVSSPVRAIVQSLPFHRDIVKYYEDAKQNKIELDELFERINEKLEGEGKWLFIFFDEFHLLPEAVRAEGFLTNLSDKYIFAYFRGIAEGRRVSYIVCGSLIEPLMDALDIWGGRFLTIYLGPFPKEDAIFMLKKLFRKAGLEASDEFIENLADSAGYHPFYMQFMGSVIYSAKRADRYSLREAKEKLLDYLNPLFDEYIRRLWKEKKEYLKVLAKIAEGKKLSFEEKMLAIELVRKGFVRRRNIGFEIVDPLFSRYVAALEIAEEPPEVLIVGHWAERVVGNYLVRKGYIPYYSHDSRGAFDIYVRIGDVDVGIQVKYSASGEVRLSEGDAKKLEEASKELGWIPILALVSKGVEFFSEIRPKKYVFGEGFKEIEEALKIARTAFENSL